MASVAALALGGLLAIVAVVIVVVLVVVALSSYDGSGSDAGDPVASDPELFIYLVKGRPATSAAAAQNLLADVQKQIPGARMATMDDLSAAYAAGASQCEYGWISGASLAPYYVNGGCDSSIFPESGVAQAPQGYGSSDSGVFVVAPKPAEGYPLWPCNRVDAGSKCLSFWNTGAGYWSAADTN